MLYTAASLLLDTLYGVGQKQLGEYPVSRKYIPYFQLAIASLLLFSCHFSEISPNFFFTFFSNSAVSFYVNLYLNLHKMVNKFFIIYCNLALPDGGVLIKHFASPYGILFFHFFSGFLFLYIYAVC